MAGALKQDFIEAIRLTPDGINNFLEATIPEPPEVSTPADVDAANVACGVLAKYLLDFFRPFAGLTPVELLLRIGQHNTVLESAMLAGLEYIEGANSGENTITILEPAAAGVYSPGEMRFTAIAVNAFCLGMTLAIGDNDPVKMISNNDQWQQYATVITGDYTATVAAQFEDGSTATATVNFSVADADTEPPPAETPQPPGGDDQEAFDKAVATFKDKYKRLVSLISDGATDQASLDIALTFVEKAAWVVAVYVDDKPGYTDFSAELTNAISAAWEYTDPQDLLEKSAAIAAAVNKLIGLY